MQVVEDVKPSATPSPTASAATPTHSSAPRRPPRKSTLTQQQKNQKRQRATQDQLVTLEVEFNKNPTPTALVRERIAQEINMTERSVQIWFQNRYGDRHWHTPKGILTMAIGAQRSRTSPRRALRTAMIVMTSRSRCDAISLYRPWNQARHWAKASLAAGMVQWLHTAAACF